MYSISAKLSHHTPLTTHRDKKDRDSVWASLMKNERPQRPKETLGREKEAQTDSQEKRGHERGMAKKTNNKIMIILYTTLQLQGLIVLHYFF